MKTCPICHATCFDDMDVCYGCLHRFGEGEPGSEGAAGAVSLVSAGAAAGEGAMAAVPPIAVSARDAVAEGEPSLVVRVEIPASVILSARQGACGELRKERMLDQRPVSEPC